MKRIINLLTTIFLYVLGVIAEVGRGAFLCMAVFYMWIDNDIKVIYSLVMFLTLCKIHIGVRSGLGIKSKGDEK